MHTFKKSKELAHSKQLIKIKTGKEKNMSILFY